MKKGINLLMIMVAACMFFGANVYAAPSVTSNGTVVGEIVVDGVVVSDAKASFGTVESQVDVPSEVKTAVAVLNTAGTLDTILTNDQLEIPAEIAETVSVENLTLLTQVQELQCLDANGNRITKNVTITWEVPNLTEGVGDVWVLHYSTERNVWELIKPNTVDYVNKTVTATFADLSPVAIVYNSDNATTDGSTGTNGGSNAGSDKKEDTVKTGDNTNVYLYGLAAVGALAIIGATVSMKKKKS